MPETLSNAGLQTIGFVIQALLLLKLSELLIYVVKAETRRDAVNPKIDAVR
jgi:hypothetical protein